MKLLAGAEPMCRSPSVRQGGCGHVDLVQRDLRALGDDPAAPDQHQVIVDPLHLVQHIASGITIASAG
jgi:hypothetical protein